MSYNIFISFDSKDTDLARDLSKRLEKAGVTVTMPTRGIDKPEGVKDRIDDLRKANGAVFLITNNSIGGKTILFDMGIASQLGKQIMPVIQGVKQKELPDIVKGLEFIKYEDLERYISKLKRMVDEAAKLEAKEQPKSGEPSKSAA